LARYDVFLEIRNIKGFKNEGSKKKFTDAWMPLPGESILNGLTLKGESALRLDEKSNRRIHQNSYGRAISQVHQLILTV
jgi:hypothetical protein